MRVALHTGQLAVPVPGGIGRYVQGLLDALPGAGVEVATFADHGPLRYEAWHRFRRPAVRAAGDVVHAPSLAVPPTAGRPLVVTVHDLVALRSPELLTRRGAAFHRRGFDLARQEAAAVVVPSAHVAGQVVDEGIDADRVHVAHHGVTAVAGATDEHASLTPPGRDERRMFDRGSLAGAPYVLFVGTIEPRKGIADLVAAVGAVRAAEPGLDLGLVVIGRPGWGKPPDLTAPWVEVLEGATDGVLAAHYGRARLLALPSRDEGFGLPVVEAMARGCPVVASTAGALPEVAGGAAVLVAPGDVDALAEAIRSVATDDSEHARLSAAGRTRALDFTWSASAAVHLGAYERAVGRASSG